MQSIFCLSQAAGLMWCRQDPAGKKKTSFLPWFVLFFRRWALEITAPFYMTGSNLLPNCDGLLIWIGWTGDVGPSELRGFENQVEI